MKRDSRRNSAWKSFCGDLPLLTSLYLAHFILWRTLRTRRKERKARLKTLRLIKPAAVDDCVV